MNKIVLWTQWLKSDRLTGERLTSDWLNGQARSERGAGIAEYAVLLVLIAVALTITVSAFATDLISAFNGAIEALPGG